MNAYVIKSWTASETPDANGSYIQIVGRRGGLLSWLLNVIGISPTFELVVTADRMWFKEGSWGGVVHSITPLENVCATLYGYAKPWLESLLLGLLTIWALGLPGIIYYFLNKTTTVGFTDMGGRASHINFKRSVIEGQRLDEGQALEVCQIIQGLIDQRTGSRLARQGASPKPSSVENPAPQATNTPQKSSEAKYFYADAQSQPKGPYTFEQLAAMETAGEIKPETFVIIEGAAEWSTWGAIKTGAQP